MKIAIKKMFVLFTATVLWFSPLAPAEKVSEAPGDSQGALEPFICDMNFFKAQIPSDWGKNEEIARGRAEKVYGLDLKGPQNKDGAFTTITVLHYGSINSRFHSLEKFLEVNRDEEFKLAGETQGPLTPVTVAGRNGQEFTRNVFLLLPLYAVEQRKIPMKERLIVLPGEKGGFYVLEYSAPEDAYDASKPVFEKILNSFEPNA